MKTRSFPSPLTIIVSILFLFSSLFIFSCKKEASNEKPGQQRITIRMSDDPVDFDAVNVDIQRVEILVIPDSCIRRGEDDDDQGDHNDQGCHYDHDFDHDFHDYHCAVWDTLDIRPGVYNLLDLSNGTDTILASGFTVAGKIRLIRLTLGTNNSVVVDSVNYPLQLWNGNNRVTIFVRGENVQQVSPGDFQIWLDFDAGRSIVRLTNNHFVLKPFLRLWLPSTTASIKGRIIPERAHAIVAAYANGDTLIAIPDDDEDGRFKIRGLRGNTAILFINATANGYQDTTINGISLQPGRETDVGTIQLHN